MCGIVGFSNFHDSEKAALVLKNMTDTLYHRGPDGIGQWSDPEARVYFGHRRLSVIDISENAKQPMVSKSGRFIISFNGEIYNFRALRKSMKSYGCSDWKSQSDTETLLELVEYFGVDEALLRIEGMFAFAIYDRAKREIILARDRAGEKPLFYGHSDGCFFFSSELSALKKFPEFDCQINPEAVMAFLQYGCIKAPLSIYDCVSKVRPGHFIKFSSKGRELSSGAFWTLPLPKLEQIEQKTIQSPEKALRTCSKILSKAVCEQMQSDVPLGAFLSGGVDSSLVVALMQQHSPKAIKTFTIGFDDKDRDESRHAQDVANYIGTEHYSHIISDREFEEITSQLSKVYDEPFADESQIPTVLVSKLAREHVTVCLTGDGADEIFGGYTRYLMINQLWQYISRIPKILRAPTAEVLRFFSQIPMPGELYSIDRKTILSKISRKNLSLAASVINKDNFPEFYQYLITQHLDDSNFLNNPSPTIPFEEPVGIRHLSELDQMMNMDFHNYLPSDILAKVDRASMSVSLETRSPFLDKSVIEFAASLPHELKIKNGKGKWILRELLDFHVPKSITDRPKQGFGIPLAKLLRGTLSSWLNYYLSKEVIARVGVFDQKTVRVKVQEHYNGQKDNTHLLWRIALFHQWAEEQERF